MSYLGANKIGKIYLGSASIGKAYLGSNLVFNKGGSPTPTGRIPYIRNTGPSAYIDTGITPDNTTKVIVWARNFNPASQGLFGSQAAVGDSSYMVSTFTETNIGCLRADFGDNVSNSDYQYNATLSGYHKYELYQGVLKVDDNTIVSLSNTTFSNEYPIHLFGFNRGGTHYGNRRPIDICACKIYKNDTLVRDFYPISSPTPGLYDAVSNTVFTNAGGGSFTYGSFDENAYTQLRYVTCTGQQYIDTGVYGKGNMEIAVTFYISETSVATPSLFGTMTSGDASTYYLVQFVGDLKTANLYINSTSPTQLYNAGTLLSEKLLTFYRQKDSSNNFAELIRNATKEVFGTKQNVSVSDSFTTPSTMLLGTLRLGDGVYTNGQLKGRIYSAAFGYEKNFIPALVNDVAGLYETYNDVFYPSATETPFVAGPVVE